jgi:two-component system response regulator RegX3
MSKSDPSKKRAAKTPSASGAGPASGAGSATAPAVDGATNGNGGAVRDGDLDGELNADLDGDGSRGLEGTEAPAPMEAADTAGAAGTASAAGEAHQTKVLLAEDDESFVDALVIGLAREGFDLTVARDGNEALKLFDEVSPDLVLLDLMLPRLSGIDVCRSIRARSSVPIIMVTAKGTEIDTVVGLEVGADDYVAKPYRLRELVARMRAVLRRTPTEIGGARSSDPSAGAPAGVERRRNPGQPASRVLEAGGIHIDADRHLVFIRGTDVHLRRKEFELLSLLMENAGRLLTRDVLIDRVWGSDYFGDTKTLDVHIKRLRGHVEEDPSSPKLITTIRGVGYRFDAPRD